MSSSAGLTCARPLQMKSTGAAIDVCSEAHQRDPRNANVLRDRAEAYILNQEYEKGEQPSPLVTPSFY